jgi:hypothetical protein
MECRKILKDFDNETVLYSGCEKCYKSAKKTKEKFHAYGDDDCIWLPELNAHLRRKEMR